MKKMRADLDPVVLEGMPVMHFPSVEQLSTCRNFYVALDIKQKVTETRALQHVLLCFFN